MKNKNQYGECCLCSFVGKLSKEHIPPKSAYNDWKHPLKQHFKYCLCERCNGFTSDYAQEYCNVAKQTMIYLANIKPDKSIKLNIAVKMRPLRFVKYLTLLLLTTNNSKLKYLHPNLVSFLLNKESQDLSEKYKIHLNIFDTPMIFSTGLYTICDLNISNQYILSEFRHIPFATIISLDQKFKDMIDISDLKSNSYRESREISLPVRFY